MNAILGASTTSAELNNLQNSIASKEAELSSLESTASASQGPTLQGQDGKFDNLRVTGSGLIEGFTTVLDTFTAQDMIVNGASTFFGEVVFKDKVYPAPFQNPAACRVG